MAGSFEVIMFWRVRCLALASCAIGVLGISAFSSADVALGSANYIGMRFSDTPDVYVDQVSQSKTSSSPFNISQSYGASANITSASGNIFSDVDGSSGTKHAGSSVVVNGVDFSYAGIDFSADQISNEVGISGQTNAWTGTSATSFTNAHLTVNGVTVAVPTNPGANDLIYQQDGLAITLDGKGFIGTGQTGFIDVDAITFAFNDYNHDGVIYNGLAVFGRTSASLQAVPEPTSMFALATLSGGLLLRKRKRQN